MPQDATATILLLLPGYLGVYFFFLRTKVHRISTFEMGLWSLLAAGACLLFNLGVWKLLHLARPTLVADDALGLVHAATSPTQLPWLLTFSLYPEAVAFGTFVGWLVSSRKIDSVLVLLLGIDLRRVEDVWTRVFSEPAYCLVHLTDGSMIYGCVERYSRDKSGSTPELYLVAASKYTASGWAPISEDVHGIDGCDGVLIDSSRVLRLDLFPRESDAVRRGVIDLTIPPKVS